MRCNFGNVVNENFDQTLYSVCEQFGRNDFSKTFLTNAI